MEEQYNSDIEQMHSNGTTAYETFIAILPSSILTFMAALLNSLLFTYITDQKKWTFFIEYIFFVVPVIFSVTILAEQLQSILLTLVVTALSLVILIYNIMPCKSTEANYRFRGNYITNARSTITILSVIAILAVDFNIFPRYFAKTESFGYSLMDVGVGLFMYSNGIVAPEAKGQKDSIQKGIKSSLPLFILGIGRLIILRQIDYKVPVSEYGVHWNFFFTLGLTKIICALVLNVTKTRQLFMYTVFIVITHEMLLQAGLQEFTLTNERRDDFFTANREGLSSILGYVSIYLFSICFGSFLHSKTQLTKKHTLLKFFIFALLALVTSIILQRQFDISRKLANSAYCFWVLFIGIFMTGLYYSQQMFLELLYKNRLQGTFSPLIFEAINYNGLVFFLIGNLLTGFINVIFKTKTINSYPSLVILAMYMFINCSIVTLLYSIRCRLRF